MKTILLLFSLLVCGLCLSAQIQADGELSVKLAGKTKFQDIKSTVLNHYRQKLNLLQTADSSESGVILRQLKMWNREFWINENYTNANGETESATKVIEAALEKRQQQNAATNRTSAQAENWQQDGPVSSDLSSQGEGVGRIDRIAFHPGNVTIMFAGSPYGGLFKTTDGGANWFPISAFVASLGVAGIAVNPVNPDIVYVLSGDGNGGTNDLTSACNGVYKTTDGGAIWRKLPDFPGVTPLSQYQGRQLIIDPSNPAVLLAATSRGIFRTANAGNSWTLVTDSINIWDVKFKPGNSSVAYCVGNNFFRKSTNGGVSFDPVGIIGLNDATRISMAVTAANPARVVLLAGSSTTNTCIGVFSSSNNGQNFGPPFANSPTTGFNLFQNYVGDTVKGKQYDYNNTIVINPADENLILTGGTCVWATHDGGVNWEQKTRYFASSAPVIPYIHPDQHMLAYNPLGTLFCTNDGAVYRSINNGDDWDFIETGLTTSMFYHFELENDEAETWGGTQDNGILERENIGEFTVARGGDGYDVMTDHPWRAADGESNDVYCTVNEKIYGDLTNISVPENVCETCPKDFFGNLAMSPLYEDRIYVGYQTSIYQSYDAGSTWLSLNNVPGNWSVAAGTNHQFRVYSAGVNPTHPGGIWRSDLGIWDTLRAPLITAGYNPALKISDIEPDRLNDDKVVITVGGTVSSAKVFSTNDAGVTWQNITYNLPNVPAFCIKKDEQNGLYVGTSLGVYYKREGFNYWEPYYNGLPPVPVTQIELSGLFVQICTFGRGLWITPKYTNCTDTLTLTGPAVGRNYWEVSDKITSTQIILNSPGTSAILSAGNKIIFKPGTHIEAGTRCKALIKPCGSEVQY